MPKFVFLWTDIFVLVLVAGVLLYVVHVRRTPSLRSAWAQVGRSASAMSAAVVLLLFTLVAVLDSVHYRPRLAQSDAGNGPVYAPVLRSALDDMLSWTRLSQPEATYSAPLAIRQFTKETQIINDEPVRDYPRLKHAGTQLEDDALHYRDLWLRAALGVLVGLGISAALAFLLTLMHRRRAVSMRDAFMRWWCGDTQIPVRAMWLTSALILLLAGVLVALSVDYHVLGTDRVGNDVMKQALKSVRTALVIGTLTTLAMLPPALFFGISAGYFKGRVDDAIQYLYTTLTSIPGVLLIAACVLMMQVYIDTHPEAFPTVTARADLRLFMLCLILGLTGWAGLCRLLRAEVLKLRELEYVQAARAFGVGHWRIMRHHLLPNVMHIVLITMVLQFSGLVLYEAVLSYLGIGVDPSMASFGTMIDASRTEMSRDPMIWWNLLAAFVFMLALVLAANIFADAVQKAFDPRMRNFQPLRAKRLIAKGHP
ncbi:MAG TPA: peptide ABC transporter permease [Pusillimonas sp.]|jgi:peptide/nickel transport system permease protein|nr:peptide ABC transporter permease [Pusillimonas sp.]MBC42381.1 peptide ABC transporter permease [Pusillimonas sp.]HBT33756.1 peptide ABC transporter permease [Pusillimonas sp.]HCN73368.1 peptide ABC transporter permease [Pusillimonas sp.]|tara:strand:+ start:26652 stop:28097 length:1446 start_codon:yes stop_codon:yes gene_type:complete